MQQGPMMGQDFLRNMAAQLAARRAAPGGGAGMPGGLPGIGTTLPGLGGQAPGGGLPNGLPNFQRPQMPGGGMPVGLPRPGGMPGSGMAPAAGMPAGLPPQAQAGTGIAQQFAPGWTNKLGAAFAPQTTPNLPNPGAAQRPMSPNDGDEDDEEG